MVVLNGVLAISRQVGGIAIYPSLQLLVPKLIDISVRQKMSDSKTCKYIVISMDHHTHFHCASPFPSSALYQALTLMIEFQ